MIKNVKKEYLTFWEPLISFFIFQWQKRVRWDIEVRKPFSAYLLVELVTLCDMAQLKCIHARENGARTELNDLAALIGNQAEVSKLD